MVSVVTSAAAGLINSSRDVLGAAGELGHSATGRAGERITVNAATGNLVVQGRDEFLVGVGPDVELLRTYNSVGAWDGDNNDRWRLGYYRRVSGLTGPVNTAGSSIQRIEADGGASTYTHNGTRYVCTDGAGQHDALSFDGANWTWTDGDTGVKELYEPDGAGNYRLKRVTDPDGNFVRVDYAASGLISQLGTYKAGASTASETITLNYVGAELQQVSTAYLDAQNQLKTRSVTSYGYLNGRLETVITDLSPDDNSIGDGKVYTVRYGYDGSGRLSGIQQTDGTQITIGYEPGTGRVASVLDGRGLGTTFIYDAAGTTTVKDALGQATKLKYGAKGELLEVSGAATGGSGFIQKYSYYANGDLWTSTNAKNETTTYEYNGAGALQRRTDAAGNVLERTYTSDGLVASETLYLEPDPDGVSGAGKASKPLATHYYYDTSSGRRRLQYVIQADGSAASHVYDSATGQLTDSFKYSPDVAFTGNRQVWSEVSAFFTNAFKTDKGILRTHHEYDLRGMLAKVRTYASSTYNAATNWFDFTDATDTVYTYDPSGRLLGHQDASGVKLAYEYDGLGRITKSLDNNNVQTVYSYGDSNRETRVKLDNGQTTVQIFNRWGELISSDELGAGNTPANLKKLGETRYSYDELGRLWRTTDATGVSSYSIYDLSGRKSADIAANGQLTEYLYDAAGRLIQQIGYATPLQQAVLDALSANSTVSGVRPAINEEDRITTCYYDAAGRLTGKLDADGYLTETRYDGRGAITSHKTYANAVLVNRLDATQGTTLSIASSLPTPAADAARDRTVRHFYDAAGRLVAQIDGDGGLTRWTYDAAGNRCSQLRRSQLLSDSQRTTGDLAALSALAPLAGDEFTQWLYDGHGFQIAQLSAEGHLTEYTYDGAGRLKDTLQYLKLAFQPVVAGSPNTLRWLQRSELAALRLNLGTALKTVRSYNNLGLLERETSVDGTVTFHQYDKLHRLTNTTHAEGQTEQRVGINIHDDWGRLQTVKTSGDPTEAVTSYDAAGRRIRVKDARGHTTFYYYDAQGRQVYAILHDPATGGEVTETIYSSFSEVRATVTHSARLSLSDCALLTGGQADAVRLSRSPAADVTLAAAIAALGDASVDRRSTAAYNLRGLVRQALDALGATTDYSYNAFGQVSKETRDVDPVGTANARRLTVDHGYDRRGNATRTERSGPGLNSSVITGSVFDAIGRLDKITDEFSRVTQYTYTRDSGAGRKVALAGPAGSESTTYDALDRVLTRTDRAFNTVVYTHDAVNRRLTLKTAENILTVTEYTRHGQVWKITDGTGATTTYSYDAHGNLLTVTDALGNATKNGYDANDNLVQVIQGLKASASGDPINDGSATTTGFSFDAANRVLTQTVDPAINGVGLNLQTRYEYDGQGRKLKITDPRGTITTQVFNAKGELKDVIVDDRVGGLKLKTSYGYDAESRVLTVIEGAGTASARKTAHAYDILGRRTSETVDPEGLKLKTSYEYDAAGRLLVKRDAQSNITARYSYDNADRLRYSVDAMGAVTRQDYDGEGRVIAVRAYATPLAAGWANQSHDEFRTALDALGTGAADVLSVNAHDKDGRMTYSVDARGQVTERAFDKAGRVVMERQYNAGISGVGVGMNAAAITAKLVKDDAKDHITRFAYDKAGNQRFVINAEGFVSELRYDAGGKVAAKVEHEQPWSSAVGGIPTEAELTAVYSPTRSGFNTGLEGFSGSAAAVSEAGRLKLISEPVANGTWSQSNSTRTMPVGASLKLDFQPMQLQQSLHLMLFDASGAPGRVAVIFEPTGRVLAQVLTPANQYISKDIGAYSAGANAIYTVDIESTPKGAKVHVYASGAARSGGLSYEVIEPSMNWQTVRTAFGVKRAPTLPGQTVAYVDNVEEVPPIKGRVTQFAYDAAGRVRFTADAEGYVTETRYDDAKARTVTLRYAGRFGGGPSYAPSAFAPPLKSYTDALPGLGTATSVSRELDRAGRLSLETDGNGVQTQFNYDAVGRLASEVRASSVAGQSSTTGYRYNGAGAQTEVTRADGTTLASTTRYVYDTLGRLSKTIDPRGVALAEGIGDWEKAERTRLGYPSDLSALAPEARSATQTVLLDRYTTEIRYDDAGRVKHVLRQVSSATSNVTATLVDSTEYDIFGNAVKLTDARGYSRYQVFDKLGRIVQEIDAESYLTAHEYDAFGSRVSSLRLDARVQGTVAAGQAVTVASTAPGSGAYVITNAALDHLTSREYDRNNRLLRETDAENYVEGTVGALNAFGERTAVRNKLGYSTSYSYDRLGRLLTETLPVQAKGASGALKAVVNEFQYDSRGNRIVSIEAKGLPEERMTQMRYDDANRITMRIGMAYSALNADNTTSVVTPADTYRYDARGNLVEFISHGQLQANGSVAGGRRSVSYYDARDHKTLEVGADRSVVRTIHDVAGNLVEQTAYATRLADVVAINATDAPPAIAVDAVNDRTYFHRYDELGRKVETELARLYSWDSGLTGTNLIISGLAAQRTVLQNFFYDAAGNLTEARNGRGYSGYSYYDRMGRKTLAIDAGGAATAWSYGRAGGVATRETRYSGMLPGGYARQADTSAALNDSNDPLSLLAVIQGLSSRVADDDRITEVDLDRLDRVIEKRVLKVVQDFIDADGKRTNSVSTATTRFVYNGLGHVTQLKELAAQLGTDPSWEVSDVFHDELGREIRRQGAAFTDWTGVSVRSTTDLEYNGLGDVIRRILRGQDGSVETDDRITRYAYDANGVLSRMIDPSGAATQYDYDGEGGLVRRTSLGVLRSDGSSRDLVHRYTLDAAGRIASETVAESDKPAQAETRKTRYNAFGEISAKGIGDGWEEFFEYSTAGKLVKTNTGDGAIKFYVYDVAGNQTREIKGNGDVNVNLKAMTLQEASSSNMLFSRVSIYDRRNLITQTIDPQIEVLRNTVSMSALYGQAWIPAFQISEPGLVQASMLPNASVSIVSGPRPMLYLTSNGSGYGTVSSTANGIFWAETGNAVGQPMAVDLSALKGIGRYTLVYTTWRADGGVGLHADNLPLTMGRIDITVAADGAVTHNLMSAVDADRCPAYVKFPPDVSRPGQWANYDISVEVDGTVSSGTYPSYCDATRPYAYWAAVAIGRFRPAYGFKDISLHYRIAGSSVSGTVRIRVDANGGVQKLANEADPSALPVKFSILGRNIGSAVITATNRRTGQTATATVNGAYTAPNGTSLGGTVFLWDLKGYLGQGDEFDYRLEPVRANYAAELDEGGQALVQTGRIVMANGVPQVLKQVITLNTGEKVTIKRFQDFNAFGEVSEERDERVGERMLAAVNDDRVPKGLNALTELSAQQQAAARTTLKYNTLGQLVQKLDPETFVTAENGYRFRARPETNYGYDLLGRMTTVQDANGNLSRVQYLAGSRGADARVQREFDAAGGHADVFNVTGGGIRLTEYDAFGDSRRLTEALGSSEQRITERAYDERGLLKAVVRKGVQRLATGNSETLDSARDLTESFTYDALGQRLKATNALNITTRTDYDALGRVVQTVSGNGFVTSYGYSLRMAGQADGITSLAGAPSVGGYVLTTLRADGRSLTDKIDYFGHTTWHKDLSGTEFTYSFNSAGQLLKQTSTLGQNIEYIYYANGYIRGFKDNHLLLLSEYAYDNAGNRVYEGTFDAVKTHSWQSARITYDELNRISCVRDDNYFDVRYEFDAVGNRRRINSAYWDGLEGLRATQDYWYLYDKLNRFTTSKGRLETAAGVATSGRGSSLADTGVVIGRGTEGTVLGYDKLSQRRLATYTYQSGNVAQTINETYGYSRDGYLQTTKQGTALVATRKLDDIGRTLLLTDLQNRQSTASAYDKDNRLLTQGFIAKIDNLGDTSGNFSIKYEYYDKTSNLVDDLTKASEGGAGPLARVVQTMTGGSSTKTTYDYKYWDAEQQTKITKVAGGIENYTNLGYDINGHISSTFDNGTGVNRSYVTNANGQVLRRSGSNGTHYFYYADGHRIGDVGNTPDDKSRVSYAEELARRGSSETSAQRRERYKNPSPVTRADFDQNYEPINDSFPGNVASSYTVMRNGETLRDIAQAMWGDSSLWYLLAESNGMLTDGALAAGRVIVIPNKVTNIHNNSTTWRPYSAGEAMGVVDPTLFSQSAYKKMIESMDWREAHPVQPLGPRGPWITGNRSFVYSYDSGERSGLNPHSGSAARVGYYDFAPLTVPAFALPLTGALFGNSLGKDSVRLGDSSNRSNTSSSSIWPVSQMLTTNYSFLPSVGLQLANWGRGVSLSGSSLGNFGWSEVAHSALTTPPPHTSGQDFGTDVRARRVAAAERQLDALLASVSFSGASMDSRPGMIYVQPGDSLTKIGARFPEYGNANELKNQFIAANPQLSDPNRLPVGLALNFPGAGTVMDPAAMARALGADERYLIARQASKGASVIEAEWSLSSEPSFADLSATSDAGLPWKLGVGGSLETNIAYTGPGAVQVPLAVRQPLQSSFRDGMLTAFGELGVWGESRGGVVGDTSYWVGGVGYVFSSGIPANEAEYALGLGLGPLASKGLGFVTQAAVGKFPVLGESMAQIGGRLSGLVTQGLENLSAPRTLNLQFGGVYIGNITSGPATSRLAQPGGLYATEGAQIARADGSLATTHPLTKHGPDVTDLYIYGRVATELVRRDGTLRPGLRTAFNERAQMEDAIAETIKLRQNDIDAWLASGPRPAVPESFPADPGMGNLGRGYQVTTRGGPIVPITQPMPNVNLVLISNGNGGWLIHTAHPF